MVPLKRRKVNSSNSERKSREKTSTQFPEVVLFLLERKMGASRRAFLSQLGMKKGFQVEDVLSERVTHIISENNSGQEVRAWLNSQGGGQAAAAAARLLDVSWYTESMRAGRPVDVLDRHQLQEQQADEGEVVSFSLPSYACQRRTTLENHNAAIADALSLLAENAELSEDEGRGVAFRRAAAVLKALPTPVTDTRQLRGLPCLGEHSLRVIRDILKSGASAEVECTKRSERYKALKVLTGIFGVGAKTADRWIGDGIHNLQQLRNSGQTLNRAQQAGLDHYDDLHQPVTRADADAISQIVQKAVASASPEARITLTGGFRRGKPTGHDVDFLITHPEEGGEVGLMQKVVSWLESQGFLLYQKTSRNSYLESKDGPGRPSSNIDRFDRCLSIFKLLGKDHQAGARTEDENSPNRRWRAVRVDLVVSPISQFAFALLGWTGSKVNLRTSAAARLRFTAKDASSGFLPQLFERELRRWAGHEKTMTLSSHALYDNKQNRYLRASSEEEIFDLLGLEFVAPSDRNA